VVLPLNHHETITRVLKHFQLLADDVIEIKDTRKEFLVSWPFRIHFCNGRGARGRNKLTTMSFHRRPVVLSRSTTSSPRASSSTLR
jgi:hypothetical protein